MPVHRYLNWCQFRYIKISLVRYRLMLNLDKHIFIGLHQISMYPPPLPFVTPVEGSTNRRTPCWLTIAVASMYTKYMCLFFEKVFPILNHFIFLFQHCFYRSICNVYRVSTLTWQFQQCFSFDLITFRQPLPCNYNLPIPISMLRTQIETGEIMPLIMENIRF